MVETLNRIGGSGFPLLTFWRWQNQQHAMLEGFAEAGRRGYTDEQAALASNVSMRSCFWKRASELRELGYIQPVIKKGVQETRKSTVDGTQGVWKITKAGRVQLQKWNRAES